jgi:hypothetical protein
MYPSHLGSAHSPPGSAPGPGNLLTSFAKATATGGCSARGMDSLMGSRSVRAAGSGPVLGPALDQNSTGCSTVKRTGDSPLTRFSGSGLMTDIVI